VAKVSKKTKAKRPVKKRPARKTKTSARRPAPVAHEDDHVDGCDVEIGEADATADADLPPARGGVEVVRAKRG
jgi:hypothetical protein